MLSTENKNFVKRQRFCHFFPLVSVSDFVTLGLSRGSALNPVSAGSRQPLWAAPQPGFWCPSVKGKMHALRAPLTGIEHHL